MAHTLFQAILAKEPDAKIDVLAPSWTHPLLDYMSEVRESIVSPFKHGELNLRERHNLGKQLRRKSYTHAVVLPNSFKSALVPWFAKIPERIGWKGESRFGLINNMHKLDKIRYPLMIQRFMALISKSEELLTTIRPKLVIPESESESVIEKFNINLTLGNPYVLSPGAEYGPAKRWPYYAEVARSLSEAGQPVWILGSPKDEALVEAIMRDQNSRVINFVGKTSLNDAINLIALARFVLTNDSGLMHVAAALDKPMLAIYGSSDTRFTPPLSERAKVLTLNLACSPCFERSCPLEHMNCLKELSGNQVLDEIKGWEAKCTY